MMMKRLMQVGFAFAIALTGMEGAQAALKAGDWYVDPTTGARQQYKPLRKRNYYSDKSPVRRRSVRIESSVPPNTIIIDTSDRRLYHVTKRGTATAYGVGVGRDGFTWTGKHRVTRKAKWPGWTPPQEMIRRVKRETGKTLKGFYPGGPKNPLGARALYIGSTIYRIHGTNQPWTIGQAMSSGCIRLANEDITHLYDRVKVGTRVIVRH